MQGDTRFIRTLQLRNLLSFGPGSPPIEFGPLNVLIGPNGSGKSNVIGAIDLLRSSATDLVAPIREGGGTEEWLWKGVDPRFVAALYATICLRGHKAPIRHSISFKSVGQRFELVEEQIEYEADELNEAIGNTNGAQLFRGDNLTPNQSVLSQLRDPNRYPEITVLSDHYRKLRLFRSWNRSRSSILRRPQPVDLPNDFLAEDASNLGLVLNLLERTGDTKDNLDAHLARFYDQYKDFSISVEGGTVQVFLRERDLSGWVPASRLSDGTLHFLCLATTLCHPSPPPLLCIEEPETELHPDILPVVAEMLIEASERTQIIVTTHSDILVDALSHVPESVLVCEKETNSTTVRRLDQVELHKWLEKYTLGDLWLSGQLGGNRW
ncbi:MAG: AAA family ATPase [Caldilineaceae bacterium]|nr:AAA family ATPase [Caldilineaceae bacterium]